MSLSKKQQSFTLMIAQLIIRAEILGIDLTFGEAFRTNEQQALHIESGASRVKRSQHQERLAVDFNFFVDGKWIPDPRKQPIANQEKIRKLGEYWESIGGRWGGRFGVSEIDYDIAIGWDSGHFEEV